MISTDEELTQDEFINNLQAIYRNTTTDCETYAASLAEIRSVQMQNAVLDYAISKFNLSEDGIFASSFWIGGEFTVSSYVFRIKEGRIKGEIAITQPILSGFSKKIFSSGEK